jgi:hypothetical protein
MREVRQASFEGCQNCIHPPLAPSYSHIGCLDLSGCVVCIKEQPHTGCMTFQTCNHEGSHASLLISRLQLLPHAGLTQQQLHCPVLSG